MLSRRGVGLLALLLAAGLWALVPPAVADNDLDCDDFLNSADAQDYYEQNPVEGADLDRDRDGYACDWGPNPTIPLHDQSTANDRDTGVPAWVWIGGGIGLLWVAGLTRLSRL